MAKRTRPTKSRRFPLTLAIVAGRRWTGSLTVTGEVGTIVPGLYLVAFDAEDPSAPRTERYVYDRAVLTADQAREWTGVDLTREDVPGG